jgi:hypothetical protein
VLCACVLCIYSRASAEVTCNNSASRSACGFVSNDKSRLFYSVIPCVLCIYKRASAERICNNSARRSACGLCLPSTEGMGTGVTIPFVWRNRITAFWASRIAGFSTPEVLQGVARCYTVLQGVTRCYKGVTRLTKQARS